MSNYPYVCPDCGIKDKVGGYSYNDFISKNETYLNTTKCKNCGSQMEQDYDSSGCATVIKSSFQTPQQKRDVLKKRSSEDFKKNVAPYKEHMQGTAIKQLKSLAGGR